MTTHLEDAPASLPPRKPPILTPKPVLSPAQTGGVASQPVENGPFHKKLERFKHLSEAPAKEDVSQKEPKQAFQTQTIRRKPKAKSRENKNYERLNVSPVRRRTSQPIHQTTNNNVPKKRSSSDSDSNRGQTHPEIGARRQQIEDAIESITQKLESHKRNKQDSLKKKPVPPPKKVVLGGSPSTVLPTEGVNLKSNNVQSTPGHSVSKVQMAGKTRTERKHGKTPVPSQTSVTGQILSPRRNGREVSREKRVPKPSHPKPQRKTVVPLPKTVPTPESGGREDHMVTPGVTPLEQRNSGAPMTIVAELQQQQPQTVKKANKHVKPKPLPREDLDQVTVTDRSKETDNMSSLPENTDDGAILDRPNSANKLVGKEQRQAFALEVDQLLDSKHTDPKDQSIPLVCEGQIRPRQNNPNEITTSSGQVAHTHKNIAHSVQNVPEPVSPDEGEEEVGAKRMSVLDMVWNFETMRNTKTLGRMTRKKKLTGLGPRHVDAVPPTSPRPPGLSRRLSRSLGNINEVSHSDDWGQMFKDRVKIKPKPKSRTPDFENDCKKVGGPVASNLDFAIPEWKVAESEPAEAIPEKPSRTSMPENYDTPNSDITNVAAAGQRKQALKPPTVKPQPKESFEHPTIVSHRQEPPHSSNSSLSSSSSAHQNSSEGLFRAQPHPSPIVSDTHEVDHLLTDDSDSNPPAPLPPSQKPYQTAPKRPTNDSHTHEVSHPNVSAPDPPAPQLPTQTPSPYQSPPHPVLAFDDSPRVILRDKTRRTLPRNHRINRKASIDRPVYAPPLPPQPGEPAKYNIPQTNYPHNRNSVIELPHSRPVRKLSRPKSESSFVGGSIYATPEVGVNQQSMHRYHVLENRASLLIDNAPIFGQRVPSSTVEDEGGYTIPGSHMWAAHSTPGLSNTPAPPPHERPRASSNSEGRPRSNNNAVPPGVHGYSEPTYPEGPIKERNFKPLNKMRRKIHEAFKSKVRTEEDTASVTSEDSEVDDAVTEQRLSAVRRTKARTSHYCSLEQARKNSQFDKLYEYVVVVSLKYDKERRRYEPCEIKRFPKEVSDSQNDKLRAIPHFCFPDSFKWAPVEDYNSETFSFVLTSFDGSRFYGYNRRLLPPGEGARLPEVFCVMSPIACYPVYYQFLDEIEKRRKVSMEEVDVLLRAAYDKQLPKPGSRVRISANLMSQMSFKEPMYLQRPQDSRLEQIDFDYLFKCLSIPHVLQIFASLLLERRIVMFSSYLSKLSKCSQAIAALLYPFAWQHVYVPVLPMKLLDMCCSPTPYIMGMLSLSIPELEDMPLDEVLIVNLDAGEFDVHVGDEVTILPRRLYQGLEKALKTCLKENDAIDTRQIEDEISEDCETRNKSISEAFILYFVELMGHYLSHFQSAVSGGFVFDRDGFLKGTTSKSCKRFLEVFTETQMFSLFIQEKEAESDDGLLQTLFDQRIQSYESERRNSKLLGVVNVKKLGQKISSTAKGVKGKVFDDKV